MPEISELKEEIKKLKQQMQQQQQQHYAPHIPLPEPIDIRSGDIAESMKHF